MTGYTILKICRALDQVAKLKKIFRAKALAVESATNIVLETKRRDTNSRATELEKSKVARQKVKKYKELEYVRKRLKVAKCYLNDLL